MLRFILSLSFSLLTPTLSLPLIAIVIGFTFDNPFQARTKQACRPPSALTLFPLAFYKGILCTPETDEDKLKPFASNARQMLLLPSSAAEATFLTHTQSPHSHTQSHSPLDTHTHTHSALWPTHLSCCENVYEYVYVILSESTFAGTA